MGNKPAKGKKKISPLTKMELEITLQQIYSHLEIDLNRCIGDLKTQEIEIRNKMRSEIYSYSSVNLEFFPIVTLFKKVKSFKLLLKYTKILKNQSILIIESQNTSNFKMLEKIQLYIEGLFYASEKTNVKYTKNFTKIIFENFGKEIYQDLLKFSKIDKNFKKCFAKIEPEKSEIDDYLKKFLDRYNIKMKDFEGYNKVEKIDNNNSHYKDDAINNFLEQISEVKIQGEVSDYSRLLKKSELSEFDTKKEILPVGNEGDFKKKQGHQEFKIDFDIGTDSESDD